MIWAMVLAAGESRRMGRPKLLLPYGRTTIIETVIRRVVSSRVDKTLVVLGSRWRTIKKIIDHLPITTAVNPRYKQGMLSSVRRGIAALPRGCRAVVVALGDQPEIRTGVVNHLVRAYQRGKKGIIVPVYRGKRGHPFLLDLRYGKEIAALNPEVGLRELVRKHPEDILEVRMPDANILHDIDNPDDYKKAARSIIARRKRARTAVS
jgi:molybdenum cofactor cytidylyltransferase